MKRRPPSEAQQMISLLHEVLAIARHLSAVPKPAGTARSYHGIYPHQSKYNPWRAYFWDKAKRKTIYLGAFPSLTKARAAQKAYVAGKPVLAGPQIAALRVVAK